MPQTVDPPKAFAFATQSLDEARQHMASNFPPLTVHPLERDYELSLVAAVGDGLAATRALNPSGSRLLHDGTETGYVMTFVHAGSMALHGLQGDVLADPQRVTLTSARDHRSSRYAVGTELTCLFVDDRAVAEVLSEEGGRPLSEIVRFDSSFDMSGAPVRTMRALTETLLAGVQGNAPLSSAPLAWQTLRRAMLMMLVSTFPHSLATVLQRSSVAGALPRHVRRAMEFAREHAAEPLTVADLARAAATTPRSLQDGFRRHLGRTPTVFLREVRLQRVRADLLDASKPDSISAIAMAWGFIHMGMFSARYREVFGELPRETLKRRR